MEPIGVYAGAYLTAMGIALIAVRNRPALLSAMAVVALEWLALRLWHDFVGSRSTPMVHSIVDFIALYVFIRWIPVSRESARAEHCFRAMLALHFIWALMLATGKAPISQFTYLSIYNGLGYLAMAFIAGGALTNDLAGILYRLRRRYHLSGVSVRRPFDRTEKGPGKQGPGG